MPTLEEQQREINQMFASLLDDLYDIIDNLSDIKWELANRQNPTLNDNIVFDLFRTIGRFWFLTTYLLFSLISSSCLFIRLLLNLPDLSLHQEWLTNLIKYLVTNHFLS